ncbi:hypothetical protein MSIBF_A4280003 [groundwater metagenome]|uniref:Uncharacterized protein n=1 Tax=groundwater metagenome TaxID=717931 RepID=A0A098EDM4_9ZZZZ
MRANVLNMETLNINSEIKNIWKNLRKKWHYPQIPEPIIICDEGISEGAIDRVFIENYKIGFNIADLPTDAESRQIFIENFFEHEICHYVFCPGRIETVGELILSARKALQKYHNSDEVALKEINLAVNFFTDLVAENFRYEKAKNANEKNINISYHELKLQKIQNECVNKGITMPKIYLILIRTLGNLWNYRFKFPFPEEINEAGDLLGEMRNFSSRKLWSSYCYHTTLDIAKFLDEEANKKQNEKKDENKKGIIPLFLKKLSSKISKKGGDGKKESKIKKAAVEGERKTLKGLRKKVKPKMKFMTIFFIAH